MSALSQENNANVNARWISPFPMLYSTPSPTLEEKTILQTQLSPEEEINLHGSCAAMLNGEYWFFGSNNLRRAPEISELLHDTHRFQIIRMEGCELKEQSFRLF